MIKQAAAIRLLKSWIASVILALCAVASFNILMDPYLLYGSPRIPHVNEKKDAADSNQHMIKAYEISRQPARSLILGSSPADFGLDSRSPVWPVRERPAYNLALPMSGPYVHLRFLQHAMAQAHVSTVVIGLEFYYFMGIYEEKESFLQFEQRLSVRADGSVNTSRRREFIQDYLGATLSFNTLIDSIVTLMSNLRGQPSDLVEGNWQWRYFERLTSGVGPDPVFTLSDLHRIRELSGKKPDTGSMRQVESILNLCDSQGTKVILFIEPAHADQLEILDLLGDWDLYENWIRELVTVASRHPPRPGFDGVSFFDFSGYSRYSTESVSKGGELLNWFWECCHYTKALGDKLTRRIFGQGEQDFGELITPGDVEQHLADVRLQRQLYRQSHQTDVQRVRDLYRLVSGAQRGGPPSAP